jgi:hypothetical protein
MESMPNCLLSGTETVGLKPNVALVDGNEQKAMRYTGTGYCCQPPPRDL